MRIQQGMQRSSVGRTNMAAANLDGLFDGGVFVERADELSLVRVVIYLRSSRRMNAGK